MVKSGLGKRISLYVISVFGKSTLGLAYSIFITDTLIAPGFPSNTARGGVLFPVILALAQNSGSTPDDDKKRRLGGYLMFCGMASLAITSALWFTATSGNPVGAGLAAEKGLKVNFGSWLVASSVPCLVAVSYTHLDVYKRQIEGGSACVLGTACRMHCWTRFKKATKILSQYSCLLYTSRCV